MLCRAKGEAREYRTSHETNVTLHRNHFLFKTVFGESKLCFVSFVTFLDDYGTLIGATLELLWRSWTDGSPTGHQRVTEVRALPSPLRPSQVQHNTHIYEENGLEELAALVF